MYFNLIKDNSICEFHLRAENKSSMNFRKLEEDIKNTEGFCSREEYKDNQGIQFILYKFKYEENKKSFENLFLDKNHIIKKYQELDEEEYIKFKEMILSNYPRKPKIKYDNDKFKLNTWNLLPHQKDILDLVDESEDESFALFMEMGTGKTFTSIAIILKNFEKNLKRKIFRVLVVAPKDAITSWNIEVKKIFSELDKKLNKYRCVLKDKEYELTLHNIEGNIETRKKALERANEGINIYLLSCDSAYNTLNENIDIINDFDMCICDESQFMKNPNSNRARIMHKIGEKLNNKSKLILSGTPISNNLLDLWSQLRFLKPKKLQTDEYNKFFNDFGTFKSAYSYTMYGIQIYNGIGKLIDDLSDITYFISKEVVIGNIDKPKDKIIEIDLEEDFNSYKKLLLDDITEIIKIKDKEKYFNKELIKRSSFVENELSYQLERSKYNNEVNRLEESDVKNLNATIKIHIKNILERYIRLQQFTGGFLKDTDKSEFKVVSEKKMQYLLKLLKEIVNEQSKKVVIFVQYRHELDEIEKQIKDLGIHYVDFRSIYTNIEREARVNEFQQNNDCKVFLSQLKCGCKGITLTSSTNIIYYSISFSYIDYAQSRARIFRIGQTEECTYYHLVCKRTIDEYILESLKYKSDMAKYLAEKWKVIIDKNNELYG